MEREREICFKKNITEIIKNGVKVGVKINIIYPNGKNGVKQFLNKKYSYPELDAIDWVEKNPTKVPFWLKFLRNNQLIKKEMVEKKKKEIDLNAIKHEVFKRFNISSFPSIVGNVKIIDVDYNYEHWNKLCVCECKDCKKHFNAQFSKILKHSGKCMSCTKVLKNPVLIKILEQNENSIKYEFYSGVKINNAYKLEQPFSIRRVILIKHSEQVNFNEIINSILFLRDKIIKKYNLKYNLSLSNYEYLKLDKIPMKQFKDYQVSINEDLINRINTIKKVHHTFKAKIEGFGIHKTTGDKTVLLTDVEYIGIDNFRDHLWTEFSKELDLPVGTTIKFKGEIYDYERDYKGEDTSKKEAQSIKVVKLLDVDTSTRIRTKLYK